MEWIKTADRLPPNGSYYVKRVSYAGIESKGCERIENGDWKLGSGHFVVKEITEWLDETEEPPVYSEKLNIRDKN
jgi:hypothetical protein